MLKFLPGFLLLSFLTVFSSTILRAQQQGKVEGVIIDKQLNEPLFSANVYLKNDRSIGTTSDIDGKFTLVLDPGNYTLIVSFTGMVTQNIPVVVKPGQTTKVKVLLEPYVEQFDEIVVSASRFDRKPEELIVSTEVIKPKLMTDKNITSIDQALDQVPGMVILDEEPQIRGGSGFTFGVGSKVNVLIDDLPIITGEAGKPDWNLIPVENLKQVEVMKGPGSVLSGANAMSGAVFFHTQYATAKPETHIQLYTGMFTPPKDSEMQWWNGWNYIAGVSFLHARQFGKKKSNDIVISGIIDQNRSYIGAPLPGAYALDSNDIDDNEMRNAKYRLNLNYKHRSQKIKGLSYGLNGNLMYNRRSVVMAWYDDSTNFYRGYPGTVFLNRQTSFYMDPYVDFYSSLGTKHHIAARVLYNKVNVINKPQQSTEATTIFGVYEFRKSFADIKDFDLVAGASGMGTYSHSELYSASGSPNNKVMNVSLYVEADKKFGKSINLNFGIRGEYYSINDSTSYIKPLVRAGVNFKLFQETFLRISFGQGYRFPSIAEKYISTSFGAFGVFPNPDLVPEEGWNAEIGIKQGFKFKKFYGYLDVSTFWQEYQNTVEYLFGFWSPTYQPAVAGFKFVNTGRSRVTGVDVSLTGQAKWGKASELNVLAGYTYVMPVSLEPDRVFAEDYNPSGNGEFSYLSTSVNPRKNILKYRFRHTAKVDISYGYKFFSIGMSGRFFSKVENVDKAIFDFEEATKNIGGNFPPILYRDYYYNNNKDRFIIDARIGFQISEVSKISLIANNLFNVTYSLRPLKAEAMRSVLLQYLMKF